LEGRRLTPPLWKASTECAGTEIARAYLIQCNADIPLDVILAAAEEAYLSGLHAAAPHIAEEDMHRGVDTEITFEVGKNTLLKAVMEGDAERIRHLLSFGAAEVTLPVYQAALALKNQEILDILNEYSDTPLEALQNSVPSSMGVETISAMHSRASAPDKLPSNATPLASLKGPILSGDVDQVQHLLETCDNVADEVTWADLQLAEAASGSLGEPAAKQAARSKILDLLRQYTTPVHLPPHGAALNAAIKAVVDGHPARSPPSKIVEGSEASLPTRADNPATVLEEPAARCPLVILSDNDAGSNTSGLPVSPTTLAMAELNATAETPGRVDAFGTSPGPISPSATAPGAGGSQSPMRGNVLAGIQTPHLSVIHGASSSALGVCFPG
jgi:hypothetical protein